MKLRDLPLGSYAIYDGRKVRLVTRVTLGDKNLGWVGLRFQVTRELKSFPPTTQVVPLQKEGAE